MSAGHCGNGCLHGECRKNSCPACNCGIKLAFASMTYGPVDPAVLPSIRVATWHAAKHAGVEWIGDMSPNRMKFDAARNLIAQTVCNETEADGIVWMDSDIIPPDDAISRLVSHPGEDFVTGIYFQRVFPHYPLIASQLPKNGTFQWIVKWPEGAFFPVDGCGFGCVYTSTKLLKDMQKDWFTYEKFSEDFDFCVKARKKGYRLMCDSMVLCGHLPEPQPVTFDVYRAAHPEIVWAKKGEPT